MGNPAQAGVAGLFISSGGKIPWHDFLPSLLLQ
jgi:hypothetical protein